MKIKAVMLGTFNTISPIPMFIFSILLTWFLGFGICLGLLGLDNIPNWAVIFGMLPMLISPLTGIFGVIYGVIRRKERLAWLGILLSLLGLAENGLLWYGLIYISRF